MSRNALASGLKRQPDASAFRLMNHHFFPPTATSTIVIVSLPKMSTTFTAIFTRFLSFSTSRDALVSSSERSFLVRKLCHSFSKMKSPVQTSSHSTSRCCSDFIAR